MNKKLRLNFALDMNLDRAITELSQKKGISKSSVCYSIIYQNKEIKKLIEKYGKE